MPLCLKGIPLPDRQVALVLPAESLDKIENVNLCAPKHSPSNDI